MRSLGAIGNSRARRFCDLEKEVTGADELAAILDALLADLSQAASLDSVLSLGELREAGKVETWREQVVKEQGEGEARFQQQSSPPPCQPGPSVPRTLPGRA